MDRDLDFVPNKFLFYKNDKYLFSSSKNSGTVHIWKCYSKFETKIEKKNSLNDIHQLGINDMCLQIIMLSQKLLIENEISKYFNYFIHFFIKFTFIY